jgi:hypothetical protein
MRCPASRTQPAAIRSDALSEGCPRLPAPSQPHGLPSPDRGGDRLPAYGQISHGWRMSLASARPHRGLDIFPRDGYHAYMLATL